MVLECGFVDRWERQVQRTIHIGFWRSGGSVTLVCWKTLWPDVCPWLCSRCYYDVFDAFNPIQRFLATKQRTFFRIDLETKQYRDLALTSCAVNQRRAAKKIVSYINRFFWLQVNDACVQRHQSFADRLIHEFRSKQRTRVHRSGCKSTSHSAKVTNPICVPQMPLNTIEQLTYHGGFVMEVFSLPTCRRVLGRLVLWVGARQTLE